MNDIYIYKQKAEKYKYKYLKLKQELEGGDEIIECQYVLPLVFKQKKLNFENKNKLNKLNINIDYPPNYINNYDNFIINNNTGYFGQIFKYDNYFKILTNFKDKLSMINKFQTINKDYVQNIESAYTIMHNNWSLMNNFKNTFRNCNIEKQEFKYGYIIRKTGLEPSYTLKNLKMNLNYYCNFLIKLEDAIINFIKPLNEAGYFLKNINIDNINYDGEQVYFNIEQIEYNSEINNKYIDIYDLIISIFHFFVQYKNDRVYEVTDEHLGDDYYGHVTNNYNNTYNVLELFSNESIKLEKSIEIDNLLKYLRFIIELINLETALNKNIRSENRKLKILNEKYRTYENADFFLHDGDKEDNRKENIRYSNYMNNNSQLITIRNNIYSLNKKIVNLKEKIYNLIEYKEETVETK
jgi:hypothetical protein